MQWVFCFFSGVLRLFTVLAMNPGRPISSPSSRPIVILAMSMLYFELLLFEPRFVEMISKLSVNV